tara:strand:- start:1032 stop:2057 length:1026 start_codon:yes stop_codon:yes gene_type:complete
MFGLKSIDDEWKMFMENGSCNAMKETVKDISDIPKCSSIYVSTKTKIVYLNKEIDLNNLFWKLEIMPYNVYENGIIKKQIKINSKCEEEVENIEKNLLNYKYSSTYIINSITNPSGRIKFKDIRKVSIGLCKKDFINQRKLEKGAFYNCFVIILRVKINYVFNEYHIKVFNTGKLELPGIKNDEELQLIINKLLEILNMYNGDKLSLLDKTDTVLVNSNFDCGYYLDRNKLFTILKSKYNIQSVYDPCSYPGIQCRIFFDDLDNISCENAEECSGKVSFMIFRTGSVLIVGKCNMIVLNKIYLFIKDILENEYKDIFDMKKETKDKLIIKKKIKRKIQFTI